MGCNVYVHKQFNNQRREKVMTVKKILTTNVKNINPAYAGNVFFQRSEKNSKNGLTRYGKPVGSMAKHGSYLMMGRVPKGQEDVYGQRAGTWVSPRNRVSA
jgi:hypothetical protein